MKYPVTASPDYPDQRDWIYRPSLIPLEGEVDPPDHLDILNQHSEGACTGFALAAAINLQNRLVGKDVRVSPRMLYEMAKRHDEWPGERYPGSSLRGAIHGWKNMGVCSEQAWPYYVDPNRRGALTVAVAKEAQNNPLGAYYRLRPKVEDYHAAINEAGVIACSSKVHQGWERPDHGTITPKDDDVGAHAFAIVGYNAEGFWIQNSWGGDWGDNGLALWTYPDWIRNVMDGWVFRPALPRPLIFGLRPKNALLVGAAEQAPAERRKKASPKRDEIMGHFVHIDDGRFVENDRYWSSREDVSETVNKLAGNDEYQHVLIYGHGGLNSPTASARRIAAMRNVFRENGIYPYHVMYDTGLVEELKDVIFRKSERAAERVGGAADWLDTIVEHLVSKPGTLVWEEMKRGAASAFSRGGAGTETLKVFLDALRKQSPQHRKRIHLLGHSTGGVLFAHLLNALSRHKVTIESCHLLAPACTIELYEDSYLPTLAGQRALGLKRMSIYNLKDGLERDDKVGSDIFYRKSLLYLVSNAFETEKGKPLLGMERFKKRIKTAGTQPGVFYSNGVSGNQTRSTSHGGFDNDPVTLNHILRDILAEPPRKPFTAGDLEY